MSELENRFVKRGYWVNEAKGPTMGQTITTDTQTGTLIIALLAVLTSIGLNHLWHLLTFFWHQVRADGQASDGLFRQQQALLRTLPTPSRLLANSIQGWFAWRGINDHALARSLLFALLSLFFMAASLAGSTFSSYIASSADIEVLVDSPFCGQYDPREQVKLKSYLEAIETAASDYAPRCQGNGDLPKICSSIFVRPTISLNIENATCPFDESMCATSAIALDSGLVNLNEAFGLNAKDDDQVLIRKRSTCSILSLGNRTQIVEASEIPFLSYSGRDPLPSERLSLYRLTDADSPTFAVSLIASNLTSTLNYLSTRFFAKAEEPRSTLIPELQRQDADVSLRLTVGNSVSFIVPIDDPMFTAHKPKTSLVGDAQNATRYISDFPATGLGCAEQYQYCIKSKKTQTCTPLRGQLSDDFDDVLKRELVGANEFQTMLLFTLHYITPGFSVTKLKRFDAEARFNIGGLISDLPDDQWIREVQIWEATVWAQYQILISDYAIGPSVRDPASETIPPSNEAEKRLCRSQRMRKQGGFMNINYFALVFIIVVSSVLIIVDLLLVRSLITLVGFRKKPMPRLNRWIQDGVYQLQRRAYEGHGYGTWKYLDKEFPVTTENSKLPDLPLESVITEPFPTCQHCSQSVTTPISAANGADEQASKVESVGHSEQGLEASNSTTENAEEEEEEEEEKEEAISPVVTRESQSLVDGIAQQDKPSDEAQTTSGTNGGR